MQWSWPLLNFTEMQLTSWCSLPESFLFFKINEKFSSSLAGTVWTRTNILKTAPLQGVRSTPPSYQQDWRHCREPAGPLGRCDPVFYQTDPLPDSFSFLLFCSCLILFYPLSCRFEEFSSHLFRIVAINLFIFCDSLKHIGYVLFGIYQGHNNKYMSQWHLAPFLSLLMLFPLSVVSALFCRFLINAVIPSAFVCMHF